MPKCPKCGKILSNDNTLLYHLNKKFPCDSYKCACCKEIFATKFHLQVHEMKCEVAQAMNKKKLSLNPFAKEVQKTSLDMCMLQYIYETCPDIIMETDKKCTILSVSPAVETLLGYTQAELINTSALDLLHEEDQEKLIENGIDNGQMNLNGSTGDDCAENESAQYLTLRKRHKNGTYITFSSAYWGNNSRNGLICIDRSSENLK